MAKILLLVSLLLYITIGEAAPMPLKWSAAANKSISAMDSKVMKAFDGVILAAPPEKRSEVKKATIGHAATIGLRLFKAQQTGDEKEAVTMARIYEIVADQIIAAPPSAKFHTMESVFPVADNPDLIKCPDTNNSYCETISKIKKASEEVLSAAEPAKESETKDATQEQLSAANTAINKAYANVDDREIAGILAAYSKAADAVIAAAPTQKLKVMKETFTAAAKANFHPQPRK